MGVRLVDTAVRDRPVVIAKRAENRRGTLRPEDHAVIAAVVGLEANPGAEREADLTDTEDRRPVDPHGCWPSEQPPSAAEVSPVVIKAKRDQWRRCVPPADPRPAPKGHRTCLVEMMVWIQRRRRARRPITLALEMPA